MNDKDLIEALRDRDLQGWKNPDHLSSAQHQQAVDGLFSLVLEFLDVRNDRRGLARMYTQHEAMYADIDG